jgi:ERCC4-type nuclease
MPVSLLVDSREPREIVAQAASFENTEVQTMDVGDFIIKSNETPVVVIERKSWSDLLSSIQSEHLIEQTTRLIKFCAEHGSRPVLLVESAFSKLSVAAKSGILPCSQRSFIHNIVCKVWVMFAV